RGPPGAAASPPAAPASGRPSGAPWPPNVILCAAIAPGLDAPPAGRRYRGAMPRWPRPTRRRMLAGGAVLALIAGAVAWALWPSSPSYDVEARTITVRTGPSGDTRVALDTTYYRPRAASAAHPVPAVLLAHGFGGTKNSVAGDARDLADRGYAVLTWTAEGFGRSGGQVHVD